MRRILTLLILATLPYFAYAAGTRIVDGVDIGTLNQSTDKLPVGRAADNRATVTTPHAILKPFRDYTGLHKADWGVGGSGGHTIQNAAGTNLTARTVFQCYSGLTCSDTGSKTRVELPLATTTAKGGMSAVDKKKANFAYEALNYGLVCDGISHTLSAGEAAALNAIINIGAVAGDEKDWGATQVAVALANPTGEVDLSPGNCLMNKPLTISDGAATIIRGSGSANTTLKFTGSTNGIVISHTALSSGGGVEALTVQAGLNPGTSSTNATGIKVVQVNDLFSIRDIDVKNFDIGMSFDSCWNFNVDNFRILYFKNYGIHLPTASVSPGGGGKYANGKISNNGKADAPNSIGIYIKESGGEFFSTIDVTSCKHSVAIQPDAAKAALYTFFDGVLADTSTSDGWLFDGTNGYLYSAELRGCWAGFNAGSGVVVKGANTDNVSIVGGRYRENGLHGIHLQGGVNTTIANAKIASNSRLHADSTYDGIKIDAGVSEFNILGNQIGNFSSSFAYQGFAINIAAGAGDHYTISGNDVRDNAEVDSISIGATGKNRRFTDNLGYDVNYTRGTIETTGDFNGFEAIGSYSPGPFFAGWVARRYNGTRTSPTQTLSGDELMVFGARGYGSSQFSAANVAGVKMEAAGNFTNTSNPTRTKFLTTPTGSVTAADVLILNSDKTIEAASGAIFKGDASLLTNVPPATVPQDSGSTNQNQVVAVNTSNGLSYRYPNITVQGSTGTLSPTILDATNIKAKGDTTTGATQYRDASGNIVGTGKALWTEASGRISYGAPTVTSGYEGAINIKSDATGNNIYATNGTIKSYWWHTGSLLFGTETSHPVEIVTGDTIRLTIKANGHVKASGTAPTLSACGTSPTISGNDVAGKFVIGATGTGCVLTFASAYTNAPACTVTGGAATTATTATTALTVTAVPGTYSYTCLEY